MAILLLDTVVASVLHPKKRNSPLRAAYARHLSGNTLALSFQSVAELLLWAEQNRWGTKERSELERIITRFVVVPYDFDLARAWARVMTHARAIGRRLEAGDAWIAATAVHHKLPLVTHDTDFLRLDLQGLSVVHETAERP